MLVRGIIGGMQQKHEKVMLITEESERVTQKGRSSAVGRRQKQRRGVNGEASK